MAVLVLGPGPVLAARPQAFTHVDPGLLPGLDNVPSGTTRPAAVDLDADGDLDVMFGRLDGRFSYFENAGGPLLPTFADPLTDPFGMITSAGWSNSSPVLVDLDDDGDLDLVSGSSAGVLYFENAGTAASPLFFIPAQIDPFGLSGINLILDFADLDGDGDLDAVVSQGVATPLYFENTGTATSPAFAAGVVDFSGLTGLSISWVDLDGDGDFDCVTSSSGGPVSFFENTGTVMSPAFSTTGAFIPGLPDRFGNLSGLLWTEFADLDGDGDLDLWGSGSTTRYFENTGTPTAPAFSDTALGLHSTLDYLVPDLADLDGDGDLDVIAVHPEGLGDDRMAYFENVGSAQSPAFASPIRDPFNLTGIAFDRRPNLADLDGDGDLDLLVGLHEALTIHFSYFENIGDAMNPAFGPLQADPFNLTGPNDLDFWPVSVDLDADGDLDLLVGTNNGGILYYENVGTATSPNFAPYQVNPFGLIAPDNNAPEPVDIDADGDFDLIFGVGVGAAYFENTGSATSPAFVAGDPTPLGLAAGSVFFAWPASGDLDGDGDVDLVSSRFGSGIQFFRNVSFTAPLEEVTGAANPLADFESPGHPGYPGFREAGTNPFGLSNVGLDAMPTLGDLDGDGDLDVVVGENSGNFIHFLNTGSATAPAFAPGTPNPFGLTDVGDASTPALVDIDADGDLDLFSGNLSTTLQYFENTGGALTPAFAAVQTNPFSFSGTKIGLAPAFGHLSQPHDPGGIDMLAGDHLGDHNFGLNPGIPGNPVLILLGSLAGLTNVGDFARPALADLDGQLGVDVLTGNGDGDFFYFESLADTTVTNPLFESVPTDPLGLVNVGSRAAPAFGDIDGDGDLDLLVGNGVGDLVFFENVPHYLRPTIADLDGDGDNDLMVGMDSGSLFYLENIGTAQSPVFAPGLADPFGAVDPAGFFSAPTLADLDADGDFDIVVGYDSGDFDYFENTGDSLSPSFGPASLNPLGLSNVGANAVPLLVDLDDDGDLDLLSGQSDGNFSYFENTGTQTIPSFGAVAVNPFGLADTGDDSSPSVTDFGADGDLDILTGVAGNLVYIENVGTASRPRFGTQVIDPLGLADSGLADTPVFADLDGNGISDLVLGQDTGEFRTYIALPEPHSIWLLTSGAGLLHLLACRRRRQVLL